MNNPNDKTFDPLTLADDIYEVRRIYEDFFAGLAETDWEKPVKGGPKEWNLHETVAHLCALNGDGLESIRCAANGKDYEFVGLTDRYKFSKYKRRGIDNHLALPTRDLCTRFLNIMDEAANLSRNLRPSEAEITSEMPIYNRPVKNIEGLSIIMFHAGLHHSAQVTEPVGYPPLWTELSFDIRHRVIGRVMRALSLLYRHDIGQDLRAVIAFRVDGPGGGTWHVDIGPESCGSAEGLGDHPTLTIHLKSTEIFCKMFTSRLNLPLALLSGQMKLRGDLPLFIKFGSLFSVDAKK